MKKLFFIFLGSCTFALGTLGIFLPLLPTTGFYLLTAFFWMRSSDKLYNKFLASSYYQKYIQEALKGLTEHRTTIVIAHRLSTLSGMDRILVFKEGQIVEEGNHAALLALKGHYALLWSLQAGGFLPDTLE